MNKLGNMNEISEAIEAAAKRKQQREQPFTLTEDQKEQIKDVMAAVEAGLQKVLPSKGNYYLTDFHWNTIANALFLIVENDQRESNEKKL